MKFFYLCFDILQDMSDIRHEKGRLTARQRMTLLFDEGTFEEFSACDYAGVVTGRGKVAGRVVYAYAQDPAVSGGAMSEKMAERICAVMDMAVVGRAPLVALNDSAGAKIQDGVASLGGYGDIFRRNICVPVQSATSIRSVYGVGNLDAIAVILYRHTRGFVRFDIAVENLNR